MKLCMLCCLTVGSAVVCVQGQALAQLNAIDAAQSLGKTRTAAGVQPDGLYVCEAEEFQSRPPQDQAGWRAQRFGENYYAATFANSFLSRKAFLGAPQQCDETVASLDVDVKEAGRYLVLVRYEAAYRFETQFRVQVEQAGQLALDRLYGARTNLKIWAFAQKLKTEVGWSWGAVENVVWEGHDAFANLQPGRATIRLIAAKQPEPAAKRNVDLVMLTTDVEQVTMRIDKESYLPLDGMLTQSGDVFLRVSNLGGAPLTFTGKGAPAGGNWQQHSPYWVHLRNWTTPSIQVEPGKTSEWVEVGGTMDSLADGQWFWTGNGKYKAEFGLRGAAGQIEPLALFTGEGDLTLAADADTRYARRLRKQDQVLYDLLDYLKRENPAPHGRPPQRTIIYASTFEALDQGKHAAAVNEFKQLFSLADTNQDASGGRGYVDVRSIPTPQLAEYCQKLGAAANNIAVVSLGDEIGLPSPSGAAANDGFRAWLKLQGVTVNSISPDQNPNVDLYSVDEATKETKPGLYYWSKRYQYHFGIQAIKQRTDILKQHLPNAAIGANFSPHYPQEHMFLGEVFKWVTVFRESGMTLPWSEDYIWQVPVGTPQMNNINLDLFRAANRHHADRQIMYYVMPHMPNNTPNQWRRLFYGALGHGMKIVDLFEFRPVHVAYTENHVDEPEMYRMILGSFRELGLFEDIVQDGHVRAAETALWFSETGDIWGDSHGSFAAAKRALYTAIRHQQIPLDFVVEQDALDGTLARYKVLYLTDAHVSSAASEEIAAWVNAGGRLFATAGAGMFDELNRPNAKLRAVLGVQPAALEEPDGSQITWLKQDLPFAKVIDNAEMPDERIRLISPRRQDQKYSFPVVGVRGRFQAHTDSEIYYQFGDGSPAVVHRKVGQGAATYCGLLPGLSYYHPAVPRRPVDRGSTDDAMIHFLPTEFDREAADLIAWPATFVAPPVTCSQPLVESTVIEAKQGTAIMLVNWTREPVKNLQVSVTIPTPNAKVSLASGREVMVEEIDGARVFTLDLDVADALILRELEIDRMDNRSITLAIRAALLSGVALMYSAVCAEDAAPTKHSQQSKTGVIQNPSVAGITTTYYHNSHADMFFSRLLQTDTLDGRGARPAMRLASLFTDQLPANDISRKLAREYHVPICDRVREALTLKGDRLAVDGVMLVAEHGQYPESDTGQFMFPKRRLFGEIAQEFERSGRVVPVFCDKQLADNWQDAKWIYDEAKRLQIPMMAGSSLPVTWRYPPVDVRRGAKLKQIVATSYHRLDSYGIHALEAVQSLAERRGDGEIGIARVRCLSGDAVWAAEQEGVYDRKLLDAALSRLKEKPLPAGQRIEELAANPDLFVIDYEDGLRACIFSLNYAVLEWAAAWSDEDGHVDSTVFWTQELRPFMHFTYLLMGVERMIQTRQPTWPVERTLLTSGALDALLISKRDGGRVVETPWLKIAYRSDWNWQQPPPPPPGRPITGQ